MKDISEVERQVRSAVSDFISAEVAEHRIMLIQEGGRGTVQEVATNWDTPYSTLHAWTQGDRTPTLWQLVMLAKNGLDVMPLLDELFEVAND